MVQQVERWLAEDGKQFNTRDEAVRYEEGQKCKAAIINELNIHADISTSEAADVLNAIEEIAFLRDKVQQWLKTLD